MNESANVFLKLQTMGMIIIPLIGIVLLGLMKDELGLNEIAKGFVNAWKGFKKRANSTKLVTNIVKPDEAELRVLSRLQNYFKQPGHSYTVSQHSLYVQFQNWDCDIYADLYMITKNGRLGILAKLLNENGFSISYQANDMLGGKNWDIWQAGVNEKPTFLNFN